MSYSLLDRAGYLGDLASGAGLEQYRAMAERLPALRAFLDTGQAEKDQLPAILMDLEQVPKLAHLKAMLEGGEAPFTINDGMIDEGEE